MDSFELVQLKTGIVSLRSSENRETFHPVIGPQAEAEALHVAQQRLVERAAAIEGFTVWDVGFGAAANALSIIAALENADSAATIHSFDKSTGPIEFAIQHSSDLRYLLGHESRIRSLITTGVVQLTPRLRWELHLGNFSECMMNPALGSPHALVYDPYSPKVNPEMWDLDHFTSLYARLDSRSPCLLTNYTRSTAVRVTLLLAGFYVGAGALVGEKAETTLATNQLGLLTAPLPLSWVTKRVRISGNAAPLRGATYTLGPISEEDYAALLGHPQFQSAGSP